MPRVTGWSSEELESRSITLATLIRRAWRTVSKSLWATLRGTTNITVDDVAAVSNGWHQAVDTELLGYIGQTYTDSAGRLLTSLGDAFDASTDIPDNDMVLQHLAHARNRLHDSGDDVWLQVREQLALGQQAGESPKEIAERIRNVTGFTDARSLVIARTEVHAAHEGGAFAQALLVDPNATKEWLATEDPRTRESHRHADGQRVKIGTTFAVGGAALRYPGDPMGPLDEIIQCRCAVAYDFDVPDLVSSGTITTMSDQSDEMTPDDALTDLTAGWKPGDDLKHPRGRDGKFIKKANPLLKLLSGIHEHKTVIDSVNEMGSADWDHLTVEQKDKVAHLIESSHHYHEDGAAAAFEKVQSYLAKDILKAGLPTPPITKTMTPSKTQFDAPNPITLYDTGVTLGSHGARVYTDQKHQRWLFKEQPKFATDLDIAAAELQRRAGRPSSETYAFNIAGKSGSIQKMLDGPAAFPGHPSKFDATALDSKEIKELLQEHVVDWVIGNHDSHAENYVRLPSGQIFGADKGNALKFLGQDKLDWNWRPNEHRTVYDSIWGSYAHGDINILSSDLSVMKDTIDKLAAIPDDDIRTMFRPYAEQAYQVGYLATAKANAWGDPLAKRTVPAQDVDAFLNEIVRRKNEAGKDFAELYARATKANNVKLHISNSTQSAQEIFNGDGTGEDDTAVLHGTHATGTLKFLDDDNAGSLQFILAAKMLSPDTWAALSDAERAKFLDYAYDAGVVIGDTSSLGMMIKKIHALDDAYKAERAPSVPVSKKTVVKTPAKVTTTLIWKVYPDGTPILESADGKTQITYDAQLNKYVRSEHAGNGVWHVVGGPWTKKDTYAQLKGDTHWVKPTASKESGLSEPSGPPEGSKTTPLVVAPAPDPDLHDELGGFGVTTGEAPDWDEIPNGGFAHGDVIAVTTDGELRATWDEKSLLGNIAVEAFIKGKSDPNGSWKSIDHYDLGALEDEDESLEEALNDHSNSGTEWVKPPAVASPITPPSVIDQQIVGAPVDWAVIAAHKYTNFDEVIARTTDGKYEIRYAGNKQLDIFEKYSNTWQKVTTYNQSFVSSWIGNAYPGIWVFGSKNTSSPPVSTSTPYLQESVIENWSGVASKTYQQGQLVAHTPDNKYRVIKSPVSGVDGLFYIQKQSGLDDNQYSTTEVITQYQLYNGTWLGNYPDTWLVPPLVSAPKQDESSPQFVNSDGTPNWSAIKFAVGTLTPGDIVAQSSSGKQRIIYSGGWNEEFAIQHLGSHSGAWSIVDHATPYGLEDMASDWADGTGWNGVTPLSVINDDDDGVSDFIGDTPSLVNPDGSPDWSTISKSTHTFTPGQVVAVDAGDGNYASVVWKGPYFVIYTDLNNSENGLIGEHVDPADLVPVIQDYGMSWKIARDELAQSNKPIDAPAYTDISDIPGAVQKLLKSNFKTIAKGESASGIGYWSKPEKIWDVIKKVQLKYPDPSNPGESLYSPLQIVKILDADINVKSSPSPYETKLTKWAATPAGKSYIGSAGGVMALSGPKTSSDTSTPIPLIPPAPVGIPNHPTVTDNVNVPYTLKNNPKIDSDTIFENAKTAIAGQILAYSVDKYSNEKYRIVATGNPDSPIKLDIYYPGGPWTQVYQSPPNTAQKLTDTYKYSLSGAWVTAENAKIVVTKKSATSSVSTPVDIPHGTGALNLGGGDISHVSEKTRQELYTTFKAQPATYLSSPAPEIYSAVSTIANERGLSTLQLLRIIDEVGAKKVSKPDGHLFEKKIIEWLKSPQGHAVATGQPIPKPPTPATLSSVNLHGMPSFDASSNHTYNTLTSQQAHTFWDAALNAHGTPWTGVVSSALKTYTGGSYYSINDYLRGKLNTISASHAKAAKNAQLGMRPSTQAALFHRGVGLDAFGAKSHADLVNMVGQVRVNEGFSSTSVGGTAAFSSKPVIIEVEAPPGTPMAWVYPISSHTSEREMLLAAGLHFQIISVTKDGWQSIVRARVVPKP